jgi:hypothetical protein
MFLCALLQNDSKRRWAKLKWLLLVIVERSMVDVILTCRCCLPESGRNEGVMAVRKEGVGDKTFPIAIL